MSYRVFITRKIPEKGINTLKDRGYEVDVNQYDRPLAHDELVNILKDKEYDAILTLLNDKIDKEVLEASPKTKIFANFTIGFDNFDIEEAKKRGVFLTNAPGGGADRVAEHAFALLLSLTCRIVEGDSFVRQGKYVGWDPMLFLGTKLKGKVMGLIGAGRIGTEVARIASKGFGMRIAYQDIVRNEKIECLHNASYYSNIDDVLVQADVVSLHVPLMKETVHLIDWHKLNMMKKNSILINTARGPIIKEEDLIRALKGNVIGGAGLDVFENEPQMSKELYELRNVVLTPHIASSTLEDRECMADIAVNNIIHTLEDGKPLNNVYN